MLTLRPRFYDGGANVQVMHLGVFHLAVAVVLSGFLSHEARADDILSTTRCGWSSGNYLKALSDGQQPAFQAGSFDIYSHPATVSGPPEFHQAERYPKRFVRWGRYSLKSQVRHKQQPLAWTPAHPSKRFPIHPPPRPHNWAIFQAGSSHGDGSLLVESRKPCAGSEPRLSGQLYHFYKHKSWAVFRHGRRHQRP